MKLPGLEIKLELEANHETLRAIDLASRGSGKPAIALVSPTGNDYNQWGINQLSISTTCGSFTRWYASLTTDTFTNRVPLLANDPRPPWM